MCTFADFPFIFWRVSCEGVFFPFLILIFALGAKVSNVFLSPLVGLDIFLVELARTEVSLIRRDRSFHLPWINLAKAGRCVTDTLSKKFMSVWVSTG